MSSIELFGYFLVSNFNFYSSEADHKNAILVEPTTQNDIGEGLIKDGYVLANRTVKNPRVSSLVRAKVA